MANTEELQILKKENSKLKLEARLRKSLSLELERQKGIVQTAKEEAEKQQKLPQKASDRLSKYLSPQICEQIFSDVEFEKGSGRKKLTIFFSDIVSFTSISEAMEAEELSGFLNFYLTNMCDIALKHGGTIDKFIGDSIMIFFGDPQTRGHEQDAISCCKMALEMLIFVESNENLIKEKTVTIAVQFKGKTRGTIDMPLDIGESEALESVKKTSFGEKYLNQDEIIKIIYIPNKIINIITS